jgi:hypothetical protein
VSQFPWGKEPSDDEVERMGFDPRRYGDALPPWHSYDIVTVDGRYACLVAYRTIDPSVDVPPPWYLAGPDVKETT